MVTVVIVPGDSLVGESNQHVEACGRNFAGREISLQGDFNRQVAVTGPQARQGEQQHGRGQNHGKHHGQITGIARVRTNHSITKTQGRSSRVILPITAIVVVITRISIAYATVAIQVDLLQHHAGDIDLCLAQQNPWQCAPPCAAFCPISRQRHDGRYVMVITGGVSITTRS